MILESAAVIDFSDGGLNVNLRDIAELIGISKTGIAHVHARAVERLRSWIGDVSIETLDGD